MRHNSRATGFLLACILIAGLAVSIIPPFSQTTRAAESDAQPSTWIAETVDSVGDVGAYTSLAFSASGHPAISYQDRSNYDLKFARWDGSGWVAEAVDSDGYAGFETTLAFDPSGKPAILYIACSQYNDGGPYGMTTSRGEELRFAHFDGLLWEIQSLGLDIAGIIFRSIAEIRGTFGSK